MRAGSDAWPPPQSAAIVLFRLPLETRGRPLADDVAEEDGGGDSATLLGGNEGAPPPHATTTDAEERARLLPGSAGDVELAPHG